MKEDMFKRKWIARRHVVAVFIIGLFLLTLGSTIILVYKQFKSSLDNALISDRASADIFAELLNEHEKATLGILQSYASRPLFVSAVKRKDVASVHSHMADLKKNNDEMDLTFITDKRGIIWVNYPIFPEAIGKDVSDRDWYRGIRVNWKPYISNVFKLIVDNKPLAVAVCVPVFDEKGRVIAILGNSHRLSFINNIFQRVNLDPNVTIIVVDQAGHIIYNNKSPDHEQIADYPLYPDIQKKLKKLKAHLEIVGLQNEPGKRYLTVSRIANTGWTVIVERRLDETLRSQYNYLIETIIIAALLFFLVTLIIVHQYSLYRKIEEVLQTEIKLRQSEELYQRLVDNVPGIFYTYSTQRSGIYYSPQVELVLGYTAEYLRNHPTLWQESIHPEDLTSVKQSMQGSVLGQKTELEYRIRDAQGQMHWLSDRSVSIKNEAGETLITGLATEITDKKVLQQKLDRILQEQQIILDTANVGISFAVNRKQIWVNRKMEDLFQYSKDEMVGQTTQKFYPSQEAYEEFGRNAYPALAKGLIYVTEQQLLKRDGSNMWVKFNGKAVDPLDMTRGTIWILEDITKYQQKEEALRRSEMGLKKAQQYAHMGSWTWDIKSNQLEWSDEMYHLFGIKKDAFTGSLRDVIAHAIHPDDRAKVEQANLSVITNKKSTPLEYRVIWPDQSIHIVYAEAGELLLDETGNSWLLNGTVQDITERKEAEIQLRESEKRFATAFRSSPICTSLTRLADGKFIDVNDAFLKLFGHAREEVIGNSPLELNMWVHPEDRARMVHLLHEQGRVEAFETQYRTKYGEIRDVNVVSDVIEVSGDQYILGLTLDITERRRAEDALKRSQSDLALAQTISQIGSWRLTFGDKGEQWSGSDELYNIYGCPPDMQLTMQTGIDRIHPDDRESVKAAWSAALRGNVPLEWEHRIIVNDQIKWLLARVQVTIDAAGRPKEASGILQDITERKKAAEALREKNAELERFTYTVSHDLKSPLITIKTYLGYLEKDIIKADRENIKQDISYIQSAASKMDEMLGDILMLSRVGRVIDNPVCVTFEELVGEALRSVAGRIAQKKVAAYVIEANIDLLGDRHRLVEIWLNLIDNAVKYIGDQKAPRIDLGTERDGDETRFFVRDNGMGIDPRYKERVFGLFNKLDPKSEGSGLGLALVKRIVELYKGRIWLETEGLGKGCCFWFTLPGAIKTDRGPV